VLVGGRKQNPAGKWPADLGHDSNNKFNIIRIMKISITKTFYFQAAHQLKSHRDKCANLHGHSYRLDVTVTGPLIASGSSEGMIIDFADLSAKVNEEVISKWDHHFLNDIVNFRTTTELLAIEIFNRLKKSGLPVTSVRLWEALNSFAVVGDEN
jgi:6-pyruvoyltetrahydropterin/6-carboxytetrahydropterin synthase